MTARISGDFHEGRSEIAAAFPQNALTWLTPGVQTALS